jgi:DNA-binding HxlR family transcriptional regulator
VEELRSYGEGCAMAHALELVGERWALLIVRELLLGPKRFNALQAGILQASANILSQRLRQLERTGIVQRRRLGPPANAWAWELTAWGYELEPIVLALGSWARVSPLLDQTGPFSPDALMLHLKARFRPDVETVRGHFEVRIGDDWYAIDVDDAAMRIARGQSVRPETVIHSDIKTLTEVVKRRQPLGDAVKSGLLRVDGDERAAGLLLSGL